MPTSRRQLLKSSAAAAAALSLDWTRAQAQAENLRIGLIYDLTGPFAAGGAFDLATGNAALASGLADFIVFGKLFTSNPDLPARFANGLELTPFDATTFYSPGPKGYTDFLPAGAQSA